MEITKDKITEILIPNSGYKIVLPHYADNSVMHTICIHGTVYNYNGVYLIYTGGSDHLHGWQTSRNGFVLRGFWQGYDSGSVYIIAKIDTKVEKLVFTSTISLTISALDGWSGNLTKLEYPGFFSNIVQSWDLRLFGLAVINNNVQVKGKITQGGNAVLDTSTTNISGQTIKINNASLTVPTKLSELTDDVVNGKYLPMSNTSGNTSFSLSVKLNGSNEVDTGGGVFVEGYTGTAFKLWLHDTSNV